MQFKKKWYDKKNNRREVLECMLGALVIGMCIWIGSNQTQEYTEARQLQLVEEAIKRAVVQCYAIEGMYPPNMEYIADHYGVRVDEKKYIVHYEIFASNIMPNITVLSRKWGE